MYVALAKATAALHFTAIIYLVFGGFLAWRWPWAIVPHVPFAAWGAMLWVDINPQHPLTFLENEFRVQGGLDPLPPEGFNKHYIVGPIIPDDLAPQAETAAGVLVVITYLGFAVLLIRRRRRAARAPTPS